MQNEKENPTATSLLFRCVCGTVYDRKRRKTCPACRKKWEKLIAEPDSPSLLGQDLDVEENGDLEDGPGQLNFRKIAAICILILVLAAVFAPGSEKSRTSRQSTTTDSDAQATGSASDEIRSSATLPATDSPTQSSLNSPDQLDTYPVDKRLVGSWKQWVGGAQWTLQISDNATYAFAIETSGGKMGQHKGRFVTEGDKWTMTSTDTSWRDSGRYQLIGSDTFTMFGRLGTGQWRRAS